MVCDDCTQKLSVISAPDPWKQGSHSAIRKVDENKLLRKGVQYYGTRFDLIANKVQQAATGHA